MQRFILLYILTLFLSFQNICSAYFVNDSKFLNYGVYDGLSNSTINAICQDKMGYMWFGTNNGLNKFDGIQFTQYLSDTNNPNALHDEVIKNLLLDNQNTLWIVGEQNLYRYNYQNDNFTKIIFKNSTLDTATEKPILLSANTKNDSTLWIGSTKGILIYHIKNQVTEILTSIPNDTTTLTNNTVNIVFKDSKGRFWAGLWDGGINQIIEHNNRIYIKRYDHITTSTKAKLQILDIIQDSTGKLWLASYNDGIIVFDPDSESIVERINMSNSNIEAVKIKKIFFDNKGNLWAGTDGNKLNVLKKGDNYNQFQIIYEQIIYERGFRDFSAISFCQSTDGVMWVGTRKGVNKYFFPSFQAENYKTDIGYSNHYKNQFNSFFELNDSIILTGSVSEPILKFNLNTYKFEIFAATNNAKKILSYDNNTFYILNKGLITIFNKKKNTYQQFAINENISPDKIAIRDILLLPNDKVLILTAKGVYEFQINDMSYHKVMDMKIIGHGTGIMYLDNQTVWIPCNNMIVSYNIQTQETHSYETLLKIQENAIIFPEKDILIIGNIDGLILFDKTKAIFENKTLKHNGVYIEPRFIIKDTLNRYWIGSNQYLTIWNKASNTFSHLNTREFLRNEVFNSNAYLIKKDGDFVMGGQLSFNIINPYSLEDLSIQGKIRFSSLNVFNQPIDIIDKNGIKTSISNTQSIILNHEQKTFSLSFYLDDYRMPEKTQYYAIVEGIDQEWTMLDKPMKNFSLLPFGKYILKIKAVNFWGQEFYSDPLEIIIKPPFWRTIWFYIIISLLVVFLIVLYIRVNTMRIIQRNKYLAEQIRIRTLEISEKNEELKAQNEHIETQKKELEDLNKTKDKLFSIIAHDLKNPFNAISGFTSLILKNYNEYDDYKKIELLKIVKDSSDNAFRLFENLLYWSRANLNQIKYTPQPLLMSDLIDENISLLDFIAKKKNLNLIANAPNPLYVIADKDMLNTVIRNLITNAIKFTNNGGKITLETCENKNSVELHIIDTGIGLSPETAQILFKNSGDLSTKGTEGETGTGIGLILCKEFVEQNGGSIRVESTLGVGSSFIISLKKHNP